MRASPGPVPAGDGWAAEVKWDGTRGQVRLDGQAPCVRCRPVEAVVNELRSRGVMFEEYDLPGLKTVPITWL